MGTAIILFGAGASYGSDERGTPPLGSALFNKLAAFGDGAWGLVSGSEADAFRTDFEQGMRTYAESHATDGTVDLLQRAMAAYFFTFQPRATSLYVKFARWILQTGLNGAVVSLNYERMLELSLRGVGLNVITGEPSSNSIELCLPHGCCHLFCNIRTDHGSGIRPSVNLVSQGPVILKSGKRPDGTDVTITLRTQQGGPIFFGPDVRLDSEETRIIDEPDQHAKELRESAVPPVMCYFQPDKKTRSGVSFIENQRQRFVDLVRLASSVAIVGVKVRAHDRHLWDPLARTSARLVYCAGEAGASEFEAWAKTHGRSGDLAIPAFWDHGFDEICEALMH